jgi:hypothetical protein
MGCARLNVLKAQSNHAEEGEEEKRDKAGQVKDAQA